MATKVYTLTLSDQPLTSPQGNIGNVLRVTYVDLANAIENFCIDCHQMEAGCVQLWEDSREIGFLYI